MRNGVFLVCIIFCLGVATHAEEKSTLLTFSNSNEFYQNFQVSIYGFEECGCSFTPENVVVNDSLLSLHLDKNDSGNAVAYTGGCVLSRQTFGYGTYTVCMKNQIVPGTVSSFFIMNTWKDTDWNHQEIDIEFLGNDPSSIQVTTHYYRQGYDSSHVFVYKLPFNSNDDFHEYAIRLTAEKVEWFVDGNRIHVETEDLPSAREMNILMNHWLGAVNNDDIIEWLGSVHDENLPSSALYKYVRYDPEN